jgi:hypothetical protein
VAGGKGGKEQGDGNGKARWGEALPENFPDRPVSHSYPQNGILNERILPKIPVIINNIFRPPEPAIRNVTVRATNGRILSASKTLQAKKEPSDPRKFTINYQHINRMACPEDRSNPYWRKYPAHEIHHPTFPNASNIPRRSVYNDLPGWPGGPGRDGGGHDPVDARRRRGRPPIEEETIPFQGDPV